MGFVELAAILGAAIVAGAALAFLVKALLTRWIAKEIARHKADLAAEHRQAVEDLRAELARPATDRPLEPAPAKATAADNVRAAATNAAQLQFLREEAEKLYAACQSSGALHVRPEHVRNASLVVDRLRRHLEEWRGPAHAALERSLQLGILRLRVLIDEWSSGSDIPGYVIALFSGAAVLGTLLLFSALLGLPSRIALGASAVAGAFVFCTIAAFIARLSIESARRDHRELSDQEQQRSRAIALSSQRLAEAEARFKQLEALDQMRERYAACRLQIERVEAFFEDRRNQLLLRNWSVLRGIEFELFLAEVFEALGFVVETTKVSGDQGVDLIATKGTIRIAVQSKGYAGAVGNDSVQQAYAGMAFYGCNRCAVITNSEFTRSAHELASKIQCLLIDASRMPQLIAGELL